MAKTKEMEVTNVANSITMLKEYQERVTQLRNVIEFGGKLLINMDNATIDQYKEFITKLMRQSESIES